MSKSVEKVLRTPKERFKNLPDYDFRENYILLKQQEGESRRLRMHYLDEGDDNSRETILLMHGEPTWSYIYRRFIPILSEAGFRVIAPDLIGFGKSDKPEKKEDFTYERKVRWMKSFIEQLELTNITIFCQDWGGLIGLRLVSQLPERFSRVAIANTTLPIGHSPGNEPKEFLKWANSTSQKMRSWSALLELSTVQSMSKEEADAYEAPFPTEEYKTATRVVPKLVPVEQESPDAIENKKVLQFYAKWKKPFITLFSDKDPIFSGQGIPEFWQKLVPGAKGQPHSTIKGAGHFLQEDKPEEICRHIINFVKSNSNFGYEPKNNMFPKL